MNYAHVNKKIEVVDGVGADGIATQDIAAGAEIHHSYYLCPKCGDSLTDGFGTRKLLQNYGFVESMPQRWGFYLMNDDLDEKIDITFDIDYAKPGAPPGELDLRWYVGEAPKNQNELIHLREELERLEEEEDELSNDDGMIPDYEYDVIRRYLEARIVAFRKAVQVATEDIEKADGKIEQAVSMKDIEGSDDQIEQVWDQRRSPEEKMMKQHRELIEWIRSHPDGFVSDKLEIRVADPNNPASGSGMFVNGPIKEGELLYSLPWDLLIKGDDTSPDDELKTLFSCGLVRSLLQELRLGDESTFGPYLKYFHSFDASGLVANWSEDGYDLLEEISGLDWSYNTFVDDYWLDHCDGGTDPLEEKAAEYVATRAEDFVLIPLFDLANHRNGHMNYAHVNKKIEVVGGVGADGIATRDIEAGEEIHHSYYLCPKCGDSLSDGFGTRRLLQNYGFVESMPQRWGFYLNNDDLDEKIDITFDIDYAKPGAPPGELDLRWDDGEAPKNQNELIHLREELERLEEEEDELSNDDGIPDYEYDVIRRYLEARIVAFRKAVQVATQGIGTETSRGEHDVEKDEANKKVESFLWSIFGSFWHF
eukprot:scaffold124289_cov63-Attheya_sp.AAC.6